MTVHQFQWPVRVYYEDTDRGDVVYYANYLKFMERARSEWLRSLGVEQDKLRANEELIFVVRTAHIEYLNPARFNDMLDVTVVVAQCGRASITFEQQVMRRVEQASILCCSGRVKIACLEHNPAPPSYSPFHSRKIFCWRCFQ